MDIEINEIEEFEKDNGNKISLHVCGIRILKKHCKDNSIGECMNNIDESRQINYMNKDDKLLITEDDYDE